ncbi:MAG TPA: HEAT repeat domain-containing protein [Bryobacteraceae bacterium]|nr:HEAT repeat domain-containing protein [Bryobacteraceae bacterium]
MPRISLFLILLTRAAFSQAVPAPKAVPAQKSATRAAPKVEVPIPGPEVERCYTYLSDSLKDKNPDVRKQGVQSLSLLEVREPYITQLEAMLDDKDLEVRLAAITSLVDLKNPRTIPALRRVLTDNTPEVGFAAAKALWTMNAPDGREALVAVLSGDLKTSSGFITKQKRDAVRMMHTPRTLFLFAVKQGIGFAPVPGLGAGVSSLQGILSDPSISGRAATALLLSTDKDPAVVFALKDALSDKDASVRAAAAHSLAVRNDPVMQPDLVPLLDDKKEAVRLRAAAGYLRLEMIRMEPKPAPPARKKQVKKASPSPAPAK